MPALDGLKVIRSPIHGYGVIALRPFSAGDIIVYGDGVVYREDDDFDDTYSLILYSHQEGADVQLLYDLTDQTRWINHACDPNTEVDARWNPKTRQATAWWVALRDIAVGEELTYDYAFSAELAEPCNCGTKRCRGVIVDEDEIANIPKKLRHLVKPRPAPRKVRRSA